jgi:CBS domain-containing membrane protein
MPEAQTGGAPLTLFEPEVVRGIAARLRVTWLLRRFDERKVWAAFMFVNGFVTIGLLSLVALATGTPFVFPSLGPTAFLFFFDPRAPSASPHHALIGHAVGIACGYGSLVLLDLQHSGSALALGVTGPRVLAAALSLAATGALMILLKAAHPPAGATTLIISLGAIARPRDLVIIEVALALLVLQAIVINRLAGLDYPSWRPRTPGRTPR